jgi:hypothetical protein
MTHGRFEMPEDGKIRPWREIAEELQNERDPERVVELASELRAALDAQSFRSSVKKNERRPQPQQPSTERG